MTSQAVLAASALDTGSLLSRFGAWAVLVVIFAETGIPIVGFFLPADTLLVPAGLLCAPSAGGTHLQLWLLLVCAAVGSVAGAQVGFLLGRRGGRIVSTRGFNRRGQARIERAERLFTRYGQVRAVVIGRFIPVIRTLVHPAAGLLGMPTAMFTMWQIAAGIVWSQSLVLLGYALGYSGGRGLPYTTAAVAVAVCLGFLPPAWHSLRERRAARARGQDEVRAADAQEGQKGRPGRKGREGLRR
jgi:membrane-associated protein